MGRALFYHLIRVVCLFLSTLCLFVVEVESAEGGSARHPGHPCWKHCGCSGRKEPPISVKDTTHHLVTTTAMVHAAFEVGESTTDQQLGLEGGGIGSGLPMEEHVPDSAHQKEQEHQNSAGSDTVEKKGGVPWAVEAAVNLRDVATSSQTRDESGTRDTPPRRTIAAIANDIDSDIIVIPSGGPEQNDSDSALLYGSYTQEVSIPFTWSHVLNVFRSRPYMVIRALLSAGILFTILGGVLAVVALIVDTSTAILVVAVIPILLGFFCIGVAAYLARGWRRSRSFS